MFLLLLLHCRERHFCSCGGAVYYSHGSVIVLSCNNFYYNKSLASPLFPSHPGISIPIYHHFEGLLMANNRRRTRKKRTKQNRRTVSFIARHPTMTNGHSYSRGLVSILYLRLGRTKFRLSSRLSFTKNHAFVCYCPWQY